MTQFAFGSGTLIGKRTDVSGQPPALLGTLQDISLDFDRKIETLLGQYNMAIAAGGGEFKISGKAKFARLQATQINNLFLGQTLSADSMVEMTTGETDTVAAGAVTVANGANFVEDFGVFYAASGMQLTPVAASPAQGQYIAPSGSPGAYTFNSADNGAAVLIYYSYTIASGNKISLANQLMGPLPMFEVSLKETFNYFGTSKDIVVKLNACVIAETVAAVLQSEIHRRRVRLPGHRRCVEQYRQHQPERINAALAQALPLAQGEGTGSEGGDA